MNIIRVVEDDGGKLMKKCDKEFTVVVHQPREDNMSDYIGEFLVMDVLSSDDMKDKIKSIKTDLDNEVA